MAKKKTKKNTIRMVSTAKKIIIDRKTGKEIEKSTGVFYITKKNPNPSDPNKKKPLELLKYDHVVRKRVIFKEAKMK